MTQGTVLLIICTILVSISIVFLFWALDEAMRAQKAMTEIKRRAEIVEEKLSIVQTLVSLHAQQIDLLCKIARTQKEFSEEISNCFQLPEDE